MRIFNRRAAEVAEEAQSLFEGSEKLQGKSHVPFLNAKKLQKASGFSLVVFHCPQKDSALSQRPPRLCG